MRYNKTKNRQTNKKPVVLRHLVLGWFCYTALDSQNINQLMEDNRAGTVQKADSHIPGFQSQRSIIVAFGKVLNLTKVQFVHL